MPLNSPGGSTMQWGAGRDLFCPASLVYLSILFLVKPLQPSRLNAICDIA